LFALQHVIPSGRGIYVAVPLALLFAYGVESLKRSTLAIASKHLIEVTGLLSFVGIVAALVIPRRVAFVGRWKKRRLEALATSLF